MDKHIPLVLNLRRSSVYRDVYLERFIAIKLIHKNNHSKYRHHFHDILQNKSIFIFL